MAFFLGVDTGGTYTDAVILRDETEVIASAKALTTRQDLSFGISEAIRNVIDKSSGYEEGMENKYLSKLLKYFDSQKIKYKSFKYAETENGINENGNVIIDF